MRISELIKRLENVRSEHGDLYVLIGQPDSTGEGEGEGDDDLVDMTGECMNVETIHSVFQHRVRWGQVLEEGRLVHGCRPFVVHLDDGGIRREEGVIRPMLVITGPDGCGWQSTISERYDLNIYQGDGSEENPWLTSRDRRWNGIPATSKAAQVSPRTLCTGGSASR